MNPSCHPPCHWDAPLEFEPWLRPQVWGGRQLAELLGKPLPTDGNYGESWELCPLAPHVSALLGNPSPGRSLTEIWNDLRADLPFPVSEQPFPWLIKWLDCRDLLSVQVHPDAEQSQRWLGEICPKSETWVIVAAEPTAIIYAGLKSGVTKTDIERRLGHPTLVDLLHQYHPQPGDCLYLPAGTVHAVGGGVVIAEVQQPSDATFRLFDWNRVDSQGKARDLHWLEAVDCLRLPQPPVLPVSAQPWSVAPDGIGGEELLSVPEFQLDRLTIHRPAQIDHQTVSVWMVLHGTGELTWAVGQKAITPGMTLLFPPRLRAVTWTPATTGPLTLLRVTLPALNAR
ncbi:hypothetical protein GC163_09445 [bacterium]|nr:hypothetical protein [bacterium]